MADQVQFVQKDTQDSSGNAEDVERREKNREISKERIERLKKAFRPSWLQGIIDAPEKGNQRKK